MNLSDRHPSLFSPDGGLTKNGELVDDAFDISADLEASLSLY